MSKTQAVEELITRLWDNNRAGDLSRIVAALKPIHPEAKVAGVNVWNARMDHEYGVRLEKVNAEHLERKREYK